MFRAKIAACVVLAGSVSGCTYVVKDTAVVCDTPGHTPVQATLPAVAGQPARDIALVLDYWLVETAPRQEDNVVWLALSASNAGRRRYDTRQHGAYAPTVWGPGEAPVPLWYSSAGAYLVREDGQRIAADPALYRGFSTALSAHQRRPARYDARRLDLNSDVIWGPRQGGDLNQAIMIRFDIPPPAPDARWTLHPGEVAVGDTGTVVAFPARALCLRKGHRGKVHWSMLP